MADYIIIPARLNSKRLPGKALIPIEGVPMIVRVWEQACKVKDSVVVVATDSPEIEIVVKSAGGNVILTGEHRNGMERCAEAARIMKIPNEDMVLCLQGDMPYVSPELCSALLKNDYCDLVVITAAIKIKTPPPYDPDLVKVVMNGRGKAIYFSRAPIPFNATGWHKHLGLYCMQNGTLQFYSRIAITDLEQQEDLEQLRFIYRGVPIIVHVIEEDCLSVNNSDDCKKIDPAIIYWPTEQTVGHVI